MSGKGSKQRPTNKATFDANFDAIFGKDKKPQEKKNDTKRKNPKLLK
jgi:uncharacterized protein with von Willebrand factor type A (vWA) domain